MKKIVKVDIFFELEVEEEENVYDKAWEYIEDNLSGAFDTEGSELTIYNLNGEQYFEDDEEEEQMKNKAHCPYCGVELEVDDTYECDYEDERTIYYVVGHCTKCDKNFQWKEIYHFVEIIDLEETK